jgi:regulator of sirC expression with transglutaminase-like and TPR domain
MARTLLAKGEYEKALRAVNSATARNPDGYPPLHLVRAHAFIGLKDYRAAVSEFEEFIRLEPTSADAVRARESLTQVQAFVAHENSRAQ